MKRIIRAVFFATILSWPALAAPQASFHSAEVVSATNMEFQMQSTADGVVVLRVLLDASGEVRETHALLDVPPLTSVAESSVRLWKFKLMSAAVAVPAQIKARN